MANLAIALLLLALTLAMTFFCREPFEVLAGEITCKHIPRVGAPDTCSVEIAEDNYTKEADKKCRPAAVAMGAEGYHQRTKYSIINNGRFAVRDPNLNENVCSFIMSDDLVQGIQGPLCQTGNPNLYIDEEHQGLIESIEEGGPYCHIKFKPTVDKDHIKKYIDFLSNNATKLALKNSY